MSANRNRTATLLLTAAALLALPAISGAQYVEHWRHEGPGKVAGGDYFMHDQATGMTYNPVTDNVLLAVAYIHTIPNASQVLIFDPEDGSVKTPMTTTGVSGGHSGVKKIAVVDRGAGNYSVYVSTFTEDAKYDPDATGLGRQPFRLYRWEGQGGADESTLGPPTMIYYNQVANATMDLVGSKAIGPPLPAVSGPSFGVGQAIQGIHDFESEQTKLYVAATSGVIIMTVDETSGEVASVKRLPLIAESGLSSNTDMGMSLDAEGNIYASSTIFQPTGAFLASIDSTVLPGEAPQVRYMHLDGRSYLGHIRRIAPPFPGTSVIRIIDITGGTKNAREFAISDPANYAWMKGSVRGDVALDTKRGRFIGLITGNMLVSFSQEEEPGVTVADFAATVDEASGVVTVWWKTTLEIKNAGFNVYRLEGNDTTAGSRVNAALIPSAGGGGGPYSLEDTATLAPGATRGYLLENVDLDGNATAHAPVTVTREAANSAVGEWERY